MATTTYPERMTTQQATEYLGLKPGTLPTWRSTRRYPIPFIKIGKCIRYDKRALDKFLAANTVGDEAV